MDVSPGPWVVRTVWAADGEPRVRSYVLLLRV